MATLILTLEKQPLGNTTYGYTHTQIERVTVDVLSNYLENLLYLGYKIRNAEVASVPQPFTWNTNG